jgi:hypothetical protein
MESLARLRERSQREGAGGERVDAEALRLGALELWPRWLKELDMVDSRPGGVARPCGARRVMGLDRPKPSPQLGLGPGFETPRIASALAKLGPKPQRPTPAGLTVAFKPGAILGQR